MSKAVILTIDGGGIRGLVPAYVLRELHRRILTRASGLTQIHECFDLIAGTSVGALIASLLVSPRVPGSSEAKIQPENLPDAVEKGVASVFPRETFERRRSSSDPVYAAYDGSGIKDAYKHMHGDATVDTALTSVVYTAYDPQKREPVLATNIAAPGNTTGTLLLRDVIQGATAAPTFHAPARAFNTADQTYTTLLDGSVYMNDPVCAALLYANVLKIDLSEAVVVSLGTGQPSDPYTFDQVSFWELDDWVAPKLSFPLFSMLTSGQSAIMPMVMDKIINRPDAERRYFKIDGPLTAGSDNIDDASADNIEELKRFAVGLIRRYDAELGTIADLIVQAKG